jgi:hypothetical protein
MARIIVGSYMIRYPLGGMLSWSLQWLVGLARLGHEVYFVEKSNYPNACYDPRTQLNGDDPTYGIEVVAALFASHGLRDRWCFVDAQSQFHGISRERIQWLFDHAELYLDIGTHGAWASEAAAAGLRVLVDGEPGYNQMKMEIRKAQGVSQAAYDFYYTNGANVGRSSSTSPVADRHWHAIFNPVVLDLFAANAGSPREPFTTVMNWQAHEPLTYKGVVYGQKDIEFLKFLELPRKTSARLEVAVSGNVPATMLSEAGWILRDAQAVTVSFDSYRDYIANSAGEFSICKTGYVSTNSGWFSDRSAAYLASGRPVVMQETGFSDHLPCGEGLFAVRTVDEAANAIDKIRSDYAFHSRRAREIAEEHLDSRKVLSRFLGALGIH